MSFLNCVKKDCLTTRMNVSDVMHWHTDAACAAHPDMKSHTEGMMIMSEGAMMSVFSEQKVNSRSSTEAELIEVDDTTAKVL